ncbi:hypothetical protein [Sphingobacterium humi]|uniref:Outer membrane beta-barrel protein n=1 Tax=Sphingobacterium humi TaxID=1796905 RepID=A0A6N8KSL0_9SPHI|nr:hypothetical protein [Sphingobacterium humi]MVZ60413.1 hypothetical protein [Sphingobacterium humi]
MNKKTLAILSALAFSGLTQAQSLQQDSPSQAQNFTQNHYNSYRSQQYEDKRAQGVFFEVLGTGLAYSFNYDTRFQNRRDGIGGRVGISYYSMDGVSLFTLPVSLNYLLGKNGHYFEMGAGATYVNANEEGVEEGGDVFIVESGSTVVGNMVFGYRKQPVDGGFLFRAGFAPLFKSGDFLPYWPYVSFGFSF